MTCHIPQSPIPNPQYGLVVIGASKGGMSALQILLGGLPKEFPVPLAVVLHRGKDSSEGLATSLQRHTPLRVEEPEDKQPIKPGYVYLAPAGYHLLIERGMGDPWSVKGGALAGRSRSTLNGPRFTDNSRSYQFALSTDAPVECARPAVDLLFESAADAYRERVIGVILTGMNQDGAQGLAAIRSRGGLAVVQDPATAEAPSMPEAAQAAGPGAKILPLEAIAPFLMEGCRR